MKLNITEEQYLSAKKLVEEYESYNQYQEYSLDELKEKWIYLADKITNFKLAKERFEQKHLKRFIYQNILDANIRDLKVVGDLIDKKEKEAKL